MTVVPALAHSLSETPTKSTDVARILIERKNMLNAKLMVVGGDAEQSEVELQLPTIIGRGHEAELNVSHALVSRQHTEVFERDGRLFVRDLGSLNGTFVNNQRISGEQPLDPDQLLTLGNTTFRAVYESNATLQRSSKLVAKTEIVAQAGIQADSPFNGETVPIGALQTAKVQSAEPSLPNVQSVTQNGFVNLTEQAEQPVHENPVVRPR
jgi:pSer/pThr/pTyr-binding forkhead associated (FHA) protein